MESKLKFIDHTRSEFFATLKSRVDAYFKDNHISKHANAAMVFKSVLFIGCLVGTYLLIMLGGYGLGTMYLLSLLLGASAALIGFNVCHDAIHGSYSSKAWINNALSYVFDLIGASAYVWSVSHNTVHHTYTNIPEHDEDLDVAPGLIRVSVHERVKPIMRYQHFYAFPLYGLASLSWVFRKDFKKFFQPAIGHVPMKRTLSSYFRLFFFKFLYYTLFIVFPLVFLDITWWQFLIGFVSMHMLEGLILGLVFQLAHVVEGVDFPEPNAEGNIEEAWALHQMQTTANFATDSFWANFFCGGLNMQIEHHLFPKICHIHYTKLQKIVQQTAQEFGVPYVNNPTFMGALASHYRMLYNMGKGALEKQASEIQKAVSTSANKVYESSNA
ncbi:MAG: acyl-CoA desaturase [Cytophagales bacterium]|nr:MAG: acyl-CoA desaturase [Cytophagales bacterium]TAF61509.1 MAG: acyl-CoA desaturase [Cytophagales bacterium]